MSEDKKGCEVVRFWVGAIDLIWKFFDVVPRF